MTKVAVASVASGLDIDSGGRTDAELLAPVVEEALTASGFSRDDIGFVATASSEFLCGVTGTVMGAFDCLPCWPPRAHSHVEGDGAFALYEAWVRLLAGEARVALVCAFSRPLAEHLPSVLTLELDPYLVVPLGADACSLAALQARALLDGGRYAESDFAEVVRARRGAPQRDDRYVAAPLRALDCSTPCFGAAALVLAVDDLAKGATERPAWITGIDQRIEGQALGWRDLTVSPSTHAAAAALGLGGSALDVLEVHAPFSHQELIVVDAIGAGSIGSLNPSGGALPADPVMATGLIRVGAAAHAILHGDAGRVAGHATNGPCLQQNLICVMEAAR